MAFQWTVAMKVVLVLTDYSITRLNVRTLGIMSYIRTKNSALIFHFENLLMEILRVVLGPLLNPTASIMFFSPLL